MTDPRSLSVSSPARGLGTQAPTQPAAAAQPAAASALAARERALSLPAEAVAARVPTAGAAGLQTPATLQLRAQAQAASSAQARGFEKKLNEAADRLGGDRLGAALNLFTAPGLSVSQVGKSWLTESVDKKGHTQRELNWAKAGEATGAISTSVHSGVRVIGAAADIASAASSAAQGAGQAIGYAVGASWGIGGAVGLAKDSVDLGLNLTQDAVAHRERGEFEALVKNFDPATGKFRQADGSLAEDPSARQRMAQLVNKDGADRSKSRLQVAGDRFAKVKDVAVGTASLSSTVAGLAGATVPGLGVAVTGAFAAGAIWKSSTHIVALNNATLAGKNAEGDAVLESITEHIKQERSLESRKNLLSAAINTASFAAQAAALGTGVGAPVSAAIGAASVANALGQIAYSAYHERKLAQDREKYGTAEKWQALKQQPSDVLRQSLLKPENRGLAERALLDRLREGTPAQQAQAVKYLSDLGLTKQKIAQLQLKSDPAKALDALRKALYTENVKISWAGFKAGSGESFLRITGLHKLKTFVQGKLAARQEAAAARAFPNLGRAGALAQSALAPRARPDASGRASSQLELWDLRPAPVRSHGPSPWDARPHERPWWLDDAL